MQALDPGVEFIYVSLVFNIKVLGNARQTTASVLVKCQAAESQALKTVLRPLPDIFVAHIVSLPEKSEHFATKTSGQPLYVRNHCWLKRRNSRSLQKASSQWLLFEGPLHRCHPPARQPSVVERPSSGERARYGTIDAPLWSMCTADGPPGVVAPGAPPRPATWRWWSRGCLVCR